MIYTGHPESNYNRKKTNNRNLSNLLVCMTRVVNGQLITDPKERQWRRGMIAITLKGHSRREARKQDDDDDLYNILNPLDSTIRCLILQTARVLRTFMLHSSIKRARQRKFVTEKHQNETENENYLNDFFFSLPHS